MSELPLIVADVYELAGAFRRQGDDLAGRVGQTQARWQVLSVLSTGDWTVAAAARRLGISRQAVQRVVNALAAEGQVRLDANPADRRAPHVRLTRAGQQSLAAITQAAVAWHQAVESRLAPGDLVTLHELLRRMHDAVREQTG